VGEGGGWQVGVKKFHHPGMCEFFSTQYISKSKQVEYHTKKIIVHKMFDENRTSYKVANKHYTVQWDGRTLGLLKSIFNNKLTKKNIINIFS
jgi:hypothetical protein